MKSKTFILFLAILFVGVGQLASTLYLPSFPTLTTAFHTQNSMIQATYTVYLLSFGIFQFFFGAFSDVIGRRKIMLIGISIFIIGSLCCALATSLLLLFLGRIIQGAGVGCTGAVARSITRDLMQTDTGLIKAMSYVAMATMIIPVLAPIIGGYLHEFINWRANFWFLILFGIITGTLILLYLPETNPYMGKESLSITTLLEKYKIVLSNKLFIGVTLCAGLVYACEITYNIMSPFILQSSLHLTAIGFGWSLVFLVTTMMFGAFITSRLTKYLKHYQQILLGLMAMVLGNIILFTLGYLSFFNKWAIILPMTLTTLGIGVVYPNCAALAMLPFKREVGAASALYGSAPTTAIGIYTYWVTQFHVQNQMPLAQLVLALTLIAVIVYYWLIYKDFNLKESTSKTA